MELIARAKEKIGTAILGLGQRITGKGFGRAEGEIVHHRRYRYNQGGQWYEWQTAIENPLHPNHADALGGGEQLYHLDSLGELAQGPDPLTGEAVLFEFVMREVGRTKTKNLITNAGRIYLHNQGYAASGQGVGLTFIALSNDTVGETATSTTLSTEIAANGLTRAVGTHTPPTGSGNVSTIQKVFTATGTQSAQKAALFTASSAGTMNHVLSFTQRNLINTDTLTVTFSITLG